MTPVQLPEVPGPHSYTAMTGTPLFTAAQLREYATEACRPLLDALEEIANYPELDALELKRIARAVLTPSETNSER